MEVSDLPHVVPLEGGSNFRDLGGHRAADGRIVRRGAVFRSAHLGSLTDRDRRQLGGLGVRTIVDLRGVNEAAETPHLIDGLACRVVGAHIEPGVGDKIRGAVADGSATPFLMMQFLTDHYRDYPRRCAPGFRTLFATLSDGEHRPLVFHCTAGKDRTGFAAALVLHALGASRDTVMHDYLQTNERLKPLAATGLVAAGGLAYPQHVASVLWRVQPEFLQASYEAIEQDYGGLEGYFREGLGLGEREGERLRELYLERGAR